MDSTQLDVRSLGTRGEIAELIGSPSWDATRTLWMPGLVSAIHSNYCNTPALQVYHTHGLVPINVCTLQNIEMVCAVAQRWLARQTVCTRCQTAGNVWLSGTLQTASYSWCNRALWSFFSESSAYFTYWPPRLGMPQCMPYPISHPLP